MAGPDAGGIPSLAALEGVWLLERRIEHADGAVHRLRGRAVFRRSGLRLVQEEEGALSGDGIARPLRASRRYLWSAAPGRLDCAFADGRPFHSVPLSVGRPETVHLCDPDRYHVSYDLTDFPRWQTRWHVTGPRKDYVMTSHYSPFAG